jgi:signal transduction histidine kinase
LELSRVNAELKLRVAELDQSHERLRMADRMATIGTLSAGLGHDMGNLLVPVRVRLEALESAALPPELAGDVQAIKTSTQYLQRLANGLRCSLRGRNARARVK